MGTSTSVFINSLYYYYYYGCIITTIIFITLLLLLLLKVVVVVEIAEVELFCNICFANVINNSNIIGSIALLLLFSFLETCEYPSDRRSRKHVSKYC